MSNRTQFEREEDELTEQVNNGLISQKEYNDEIRALYRSYRDASEEAAREAYEQELERW